jgi:ribosomal protein S18 acetylase RimI-like enzyme
MTEPAHILYAREPDLTLAEFRQILVESGMAAIRPMDDDDRLRAMLAASGLIVTARRGGPDGPVVGVARGITDGVWCCYIAELAVSASAQRLGIGRGLLDEARRQLGPRVSIMLASVPDAVGFYERAGMMRIADAFWYRREQ